MDNEKVKENFILGITLRCLAAVLMFGLTMLGCAETLGAAPRPSQMSVAGVASWAQPLTASGTGLPATSTYLPGDLFFIYDPASWTAYRLNASGSWVQQVASGTGGAGTTGDSATLTAHIASETGVHGVPGALAADADLDAHAADQTDPHGASMTVSQDMTIGSGAATATVRNIGTYTVEIASYIRLLPVTATPSGALDGTIWYDANTQKFRGLASGSWVDF